MKYLILCLFLLGAGCGDDQTLLGSPQPTSHWAAETHEGNLCVSFVTGWGGVVAVKCAPKGKDNEQTAKRLKQQIEDEFQAQNRERQQLRDIEGILNGYATTTAGIPIN